MLRLHKLKCSAVENQSISDLLQYVAGTTRYCFIPTFPQLETESGQKYKKNHSFFNDCV